MNEIIVREILRRKQNRKDLSKKRTNQKIMEQRQQIWAVSHVGLVSNALGLNPGPAVGELVTWANLLISSSLSLFI